MIYLPEPSQHLQEISSYRNDSPIIETNPIIHFSIFLYEFENSIIITKIVTSIAPIFIGILKSIFKAIEPPRISAREVETEARTAKDSTDFETQGLRYMLPLPKDKDRLQCQDEQRYAAEQ